MDTLVIYLTTPTPTPINRPEDWILDETATETQGDGKSTVWRYETESPKRDVTFWLNWLYAVKKITNFQIL